MVSICLLCVGKVRSLFNSKIPANITKTRPIDKATLLLIYIQAKELIHKCCPRLFTRIATKSFAGTGLGLFASKYIIEAHGGEKWAKNDVEGKGATFSFTLPMTQ